MSETLWTLYEQGQLNKNVYHSISNDSYHNGPGISSSQIKKAINQSAGHALFKSESKTTPAMAFGTAFHTYAMEPEKFNASSIKPADFEIILKMTNNLFSHKLASEIMFDSQHELSFYSKHQETGLLLKARVDGINKKNVIWDLKT